MAKTHATHDQWAKRKRRVRKKIEGTPERPRLVVFRSNKHVYAQIVDDLGGRTLAAASTMESGLPNGSNATSAAAVGAAVADRAKAAGVSSVVFDRNGYLYHGRVKALADAARDGGLTF